MADQALLLPPYSTSVYCVWFDDNKKTTRPSVFCCMQQYGMEDAMLPLTFRAVSCSKR